MEKLNDLVRRISIISMRTNLKYVICFCYNDKRRPCLGLTINFYKRELTSYSLIEDIDENMKSLSKTVALIDDLCVDVNNNFVMPLYEGKLFNNIKIDNDVIKVM